MLVSVQYSLIQRIFFLEIYKRKKLCDIRCRKSVTHFPVV